MKTYTFKCKKCEGSLYLTDLDLKILEQNRSNVVECPHCGFPYGVEGFALGEINTKDTDSEILEKIKAELDERHHRFGRWG